MQRVIKEVPASAYENVKFSAGDKAQLAVVVAQVISASNVNWTNIRSAKFGIAHKIRSVPESYFRKKYQSFDGVVSYWTTPGRYLGSEYVVIGGIYALIAAGLLFVFGGGTLSLITLCIALVSLCVAWILKTFEYNSVPPQEILKVRATFIESATKFCDKEVEIQLQKLLYSSQSNNPKDLFNSVEGRWQPLGPRPVPQAAGMSPQDAEHFVAEYLRFYGAGGVSVTRFSRDGGIDVETTNFVAQVKHVQANVGVKAVREIYAIAVSKNKEALFFAKVGYTKDAIDFATQNRIALFTYLPHLQGYEPRAKTYLDKGMASPLNF